MLTPDEKGAIAELAIAHAASKLRIGVLKPLTDGERYDLVFDLRPSLLRVQCKWASKQGEVVVIRCYSCRRSRLGMIKRVYTGEEVDIIAAYCAELDRCYLLPLEMFDGRSHIQLRLSSTLNNQRLGINWADDFDFAAKLREQLGAIAQLGERVRGTHEVAGSSPAGSTLFT
jgi:PD-(D/E)XK endonuclease